MTIKELIEELEQIKNKELPVYIWDTKQCELLGNIKSIDVCISDRIDLCV